MLLNWNRWLTFDLEVLEHSSKNYAQHNKIKNIFISLQKYQKFGGKLET